MRRHSARSGWSRKPGRRLCSERRSTDRRKLKTCFPATAQVFQQQNHLALLVGGSTLCRQLLVAGDAFGPLRARGARTASRVQDASSQESGDELQFIRRKTLYEAPGLGFTRTIGTRNQSGNQSTSHARTPVGEKSYSFLESGRIMSKSATGRKGPCAVIGNQPRRLHRLTEYWWCVRARLRV